MSELKKIIILSKNKRLARLCEIEAGFCGFSVHISENPHTDFSEYSLAVVDIDTVSPTHLRGECGILGITTRDIKTDDNTFKLTYLIKYPFLLRDLRDILCRVSQAGEEKIKNDSEADDMTIYADASNKEIIFCGRKIALSEYEFIVLERLCEKSGSAVEREELSSLLGAEKGNIVEVYICHLRKKLERISTRKVIHTVRARGYLTHWSMIYI